MHVIWKGSVNFGLVNIPVNMYSASEARELKFKLLHKKDLSEVRYARICKEDGKEIPWQEIVKGYEIDGKYIVMTEEDFQRANLKKTRSIEILDFTEENQIPTIYYETPYFLEPQKDAHKAYRLFLEALKQAGKVAVGRFVFHSHEHLGVIRVYQGILVLHTLRYQMELRDFREIKAPKTPISKIELKMAIRLIEELTQPFHPEAYRDAYSEELKAMMRKKAKGQKMPVKRESVKRPKMEDILPLLKQSLEIKGGRKKKRSASHTSRSL
jgi:DNA end-binding protein Ku